MKSNCRRKSAGYDAAALTKMPRLVATGWLVVALAASIFVPIRIAEIFGAHHRGLLICAAIPADAYSPIFAVSHSNQNQGNLKDE